MKRRYGKYNAKRRLAPPPAGNQGEVLKSLVKNVRYGGNPEHKKNPGDFGLRPPSNPRLGKSLCDTVGIFKRCEAKRLLQQGLRLGLVSDRQKDGWPQNIWALTATGKPVEAQLENPVSGIYHGYPMPDSDPFACAVKDAWTKRHVEN